MYFTFKYFKLAYFHFHRYIYLRCQQQSQSRMKKNLSLSQEASELLIDTFILLLHFVASDSQVRFIPFPYNQLMYLMFLFSSILHMCVPQHSYSLFYAACDRCSLVLVNCWTLSNGIFFLLLTSPYMPQFMRP